MSLSEDEDDSMNRSWSAKAAIGIPSMHRRVALAAALATLVSLVGTANAASPASWSAVDVAVGPETQPSGQPENGRSETAVAVDPVDPQKAIILSMDWNYAAQSAPCCARGFFSVAIFTTNDSGASWTSRGFVPSLEPSTCTQSLAADPAVSFDPGGVAYVSYLSYCAQGTGPMKLAVMSSHDGGISWNTPATVTADSNDGATCGAEDKDYMGTADAGTVYVTWLESLYDCQTRESRGLYIYFSISHDNGFTWTAPKAISGSPHLWMEGPVPRADAAGNLFVAYYEDAPLDPTCPSVTTLLIHTDPGSIRSTEMMIARSSDGGGTWSQTRVTGICDNQYASPDQPMGLNNWLSDPSLAVDRGDATIHLAWSNRDAPSAAIHIAVSRDGGSTWSQSTLADPGWSDFMPWIVADAGAARLVYVAENAGGLYNVAYRESLDGGQTWSQPLQLNTAPLSLVFSAVNGPYQTDPLIGHYIGLGAAAGSIVPAWPDDRSLTGVQNVFTRPGHYGS